MPLDPGTRLGAYEIISPIGAGGMGEVYRARDTRLGRDVAIKILPSTLAQTEEALARFEREARTLGALSHPNILCIYDVGRAEGQTFLVTELLEGSTLRTLIQEKLLSPQKSLALASSIADGLAAAHAKGIIHRDLKPDNIFVTPDERVKILDFGLARSMTPGPHDQRETATLISSPGALLGTVAYMSPEQVRGEPLTPSSDLFSFGAILHEMLAGTRAFPGDSAGETIASVLREDPPDLETSPEVAAIVRHCLEKNPDARFRTAGDLAFALRSASMSPSSRTTRSVKPAVKRRARIAAAAGFVILLLGSLAALSWWQNSTTNVRSTQNKIESIAVLPFVNASPNGKIESDYLSDGITEMVINSLSPLRSLRVMSRDSVFRYKNSEKPLSMVAKELGVDAVITGRILHLGDSLIVSTELIDGKDQHQIWGDRFTEKFSDVFNVEEKISTRISEKLKLELSGDEQKRLRQRSTTDPNAYALYLQGRYEWNKRTPEGLRRAMRLFQDAIDHDPNYSLAHAGLADAYVLLGSLYEVVPPKESMPVARAAAEKALALDPLLAEPHAALGVVEHEFDWDPPQAEAQFRKALEINPNFATGHHWYGMFLVYQGRFDAGLSEVRKAEELDPLSMVIKADIGQGLFMARRFDESIAQSKKVIELAPGFWLPHLVLGLAYAEKGMLPEAIASVEQAAELGGHPAARGSLAFLYARAGRRESASKLLESFERESRQRYISPFTFFALYGGLGENDRAFSYLDRSFEERSSFISMLRVLPTLDPIRSDPRFGAFLQKVERARVHPAQG